MSGLRGDVAIRAFESPLKRYHRETQEALLDHREARDEQSRPWRRWQPARWSPRGPSTPMRTASPISSNGPRGRRGPRPLDRSFRTGSPEDLVHGLVRALHRRVDPEADARGGRPETRVELPDAPSVVVAGLR